MNHMDLHEGLDHMMRTAGLCAGHTETLINIDIFVYIKKNNSAMLTKYSFFISTCKNGMVLHLLYFHANLNKESYLNYNIVNVTV